MIEAAPFIVVAGNIASGKSTMAKALASAFEVPAYLEHPDHNPFIGDFYADPARWAFASQLWFLLDTLEDQREAGRGGVQDHSAYENLHVFGSVLGARGELTAREFAALERLSRFGDSFLSTPDVVVLLETSIPELKCRISARGRRYERQISDQYLSQLGAPAKPTSAHGPGVLLS